MKRIHLKIIKIIIIVFFISGCATVPEEKPVLKATFVAAGDVMLDRRMKTYMKEKGSIYPFWNITQFIKRHDLSFCNLEGPVSLRGTKVEKAFSFRFDPGLLDGLENSGFNMYSLANNHMLDYGGEAVLDTITFMEQHDYYYSGAGRNRKEAVAAQYREVNGIKFAFISNVDFFMDGWKNKVEGTRPQPFDRGKLSELTAEIKKADELADFVIVSFHWGEEYKHYPNNRQKSIAHSCIDSGADLILGHHPHVMQGVEKYKGKLIFYSLGNFIFDQRFPSTHEAMVFSCDFTKEGMSGAYILPVRIKKGRPQIASGEDASIIKDKIIAYSKDFDIELNKENVKIQIK